MNTFVCTSEKKQGESKVGIAMAYKQNEQVEYYYMDYKDKNFSIENQNLLAVFAVLRKIEELNIKETTIYHDSVSLDVQNKEKMKNRYVQYTPVWNRIRRLEQKGFRFTFVFYIRKKRHPINSIREQMLRFLQLGKIKNTKIKKIKRKKPLIKIEKIKQIATHHSKNPMIALLNNRNMVIDYLDENKAENILNQKKGKKIYTSAILTNEYDYKSHATIRWLNIMHLRVTDKELAMDRMLPLEERRFITLITGNHSYVISRSVADQLVMGHMAVYLSEDKHEIVLKYNYKEFRDYLLNRDGNLCQYCELQEATTLEHILPRSKGGITTIFNCILCCENCNTLKSNMDIHQFYEFLENP